MKKTLAIFLSAALAAVMLSASAYGAEVPECTQGQFDVEKRGGAVEKDFLTGEVKYVPESDFYSYVDDEDVGYEDSSSFDSTGSEEQIQSYMSNNLKKITDTTTSIAARQTVHLKISTTNDPYTATGFLIAPNIVVTAGHNLYNSEYGGGYWVRK